MKLILFLFCFFNSFFCFAQQELNGSWKGKITHEDGGYTPEYSFELYIILKGDSITGRSYVYVDSIYAEMDISGTVHSGIYLELKDEIILEHEELHGMEWCIKRYQLILVKREQVYHLEGHWQGETSFSSCVPGKVYLKKKKPRA